MKLAPSRRRALARALVARELQKALSLAGPCQRGLTFEFYLRFYNLGLVARSAYKVLGPIRSIFSLYRWRRRYAGSSRKSKSSKRGGHV
ncbi:MAG: hypothetical protein V1797_17210 [Pseudomonadota bacterium]